MLAGALTLVLPPGGERLPASRVPLVRQTIRLLAVRGPLRRVTLLMVVAAIPAGALGVLTVALSGELGASPAAGAAMVAAFGFGHLLGGLALTAFPLTGEPEVVIGRWIAAVGVGFAACAAVPTAEFGVLAFGLLGVIDAPFFTATLAARSEYAPPGARAQVFVSMAGLKIAGAAIGSALAGALIGLGAQALLVLGGVLICAAAVLTVVDRRATHRGRREFELPRQPPGGIG